MGLTDAERGKCCSISSCHTLNPSMVVRTRTRLHFPFSASIPTASRILFVFPVRGSMNSAKLPWRAIPLVAFHWWGNGEVLKRYFGMALVGQHHVGDEVVTRGIGDDERLRALTAILP